jgi:hypothetical protein
VVKKIKKTMDQITELISNNIVEYLIKEMVFSRSKTIKRIMDLQNILWIEMHRDEKKYFEDMDDSGLKRQLSMHEFTLANKV